MHNKIFYLFIEKLQINNNNFKNIVIPNCFIRITGTNSQGRHS